MSDKPYKFLPLPPGFAPTYCTVDEACAYARCSRWTGFQRIRQRRWLAFKDGPDYQDRIDTVVEDMKRTKAESRVASTGKRRPGRPRKHHPEEQPQTAAE